MFCTVYTCVFIVNEMSIKSLSSDPSAATNYYLNDMYKIIT